MVCVERDDIWDWVCVEDYVSWNQFNSDAGLFDVMVSFG